MVLMSPEYGITLGEQIKGGILKSHVFHSVNGPRDWGMKEG